MIDNKTPALFSCICALVVARSQEIERDQYSMQPNKNQGNEHNREAYRVRTFHEANHHRNAYGQCSEDKE